MQAAGDAIRSVPSGINQTSFMFGAVFVAWLFFITVRGDLPKWLGLLGLGNDQGTTASGASSAGSSMNLLAPSAIPGIGDEPTSLIPNLPGLG